jgi:tetratricopeptide (TPR) repeat protein
MLISHRRRVGLTAKLPLRAVLAPTLLTATLLAVGCATPGAVGPARVEVQEGGFTISEEVRVGFGVRSAFDDGVQAIEDERYDDAIALLQEVTQDAPELTPAHIDLGLAYRGAGDFESAERSLRRALELNPRHPVALNELGIVYRKTGRFELARESYERALDEHPGFHYARKNLAILCDLYLRDPECALEHYEAYARAAPTDENAAIWVADLRKRVGR